MRRKKECHQGDPRKIRTRKTKKIKEAGIWTTGGDALENLEKWPQAQGRSVKRPRKANPLPAQRVDDSQRSIRIGEKTEERSGFTMIAWGAPFGFGEEGISKLESRSSPPLFMSKRVRNSASGSAGKRGQETISAE